MKTAANGKRQGGFSLLELLVATLIFLILSGAVFGLLDVSQQRSQAESQTLSAFQEARLGLDQIVRDVNVAGYPAYNNYDPSTIVPAVTKYVQSPIAWNPTYPGTPCTIGGSCTTPSGFDLIIETTIDPQNSPGVDWVRYQLSGTTLFRGVAKKAAATDPAAATASTLVPFVQNVVNNVPGAQIAQIQAVYPSMFPGGTAVPVFALNCDTPAGMQACSAAGASNSPLNIRDIEITLIVQAPQPDMQTGRLLLVELKGRGHRINPNQ